MKNSRVNKILEEMAKEGLSQIIITSPASIFYLTGKMDTSRGKNDCIIHK